MRLFIDECLSPLLALRLNALGRFDAVHPLHIGARGPPDRLVVARCLAEDRIIVTRNGRDFMRLLRRLELHPGLVVLPALEREKTWRLLLDLLARLEARGDPADVVVNQVLEVEADLVPRLYPLP